MTLELLTPGSEPRLAFIGGVERWPALHAPPPQWRLALLNDGVVHACASIWTDAVAAYRGTQPAYIGHLSASAPDRLTELLEGTTKLRELAGRPIIGPIDGSTWSRYRILTESSGEPSFPMEPTNLPWWPESFANAGFGVIERYWSALRSVDEIQATKPAPIPDGIRLRALDPHRLESDLDAIYDLSVGAFAANPLYTPIPRDAFRAMYSGVARSVDPRFCLFAEASGPVGVMFAFSDPLGRLVLKSIAVADHARSSGLGTAMLDQVALQAQAQGITKLIYALMHESNRSSSMVAKVAEPMRRYSLFGVGFDDGVAQ
ncbi:MAG: GNAT family N-acetyltransferase [Planctomycetota bacterium]